MLGRQTSVDVSEGFNVQQVYNIIEESIISTMDVVSKRHKEKPTKLSGETHRLTQRDRVRRINRKYEKRNCGLKKKLVK